MKNPNRYLVIYILVAVIFACSWTITYGASVVSIGKDGTSEYLLYPTDSLSAHRFIGTSTSAVNTFPTALFTSASTTNFGITSVLSKILKTGSDGHIEGATAGVDYENPLTVTSPITRTLNALGFDFSTQNTWTGHNIFSSFFATNATTTNATTTTFAVTGLGTSTFAGSILLQNNGHLTVHGILADGSDGLHMNAGNGTEVVNLGAGNSANALFYGGVNINGATRLATSLNGLAFLTNGAVSGIATSTLNLTTSSFASPNISQWTNDAGYEAGLTAGDALTRTGNDFDFDGGTVPAGALGGTWASPTVDDDGHNHTGTTLSGIDISSDTNLTADGTEIVLTDDALSLGTSLTFTQATTTNFAVSSITSALMQTNGNGTVEEYAGTTCTNQLVRSLSALGIATCATVQTTDVASGIALDSELPTGSNPSATIGLTANNGVATTFMRSDATPALGVTIAPTWTNGHTWSSLTATSSFQLLSIGSTTPDATALFAIGTSSPLMHVNKASGKIGFGSVNTSPAQWTFGIGGSNPNVNPNINLLAVGASDARLGASAGDKATVIKGGATPGLYAYDYLAGSALPLVLNEFGGVVSVSTGGFLSMSSSTIQNLFSTNASTTNLIVSSAGGSAGCATFAIGGALSNTGVACGSGGGGGDSKFSTSTINPLAIYMNAGDSLGLGTTTNRSALSMFTIATTTGTHITFRNGNHTWFQKVNDTGSLFIGTTTGAYATSSHTALIVPATGGLIVQGSGSSTLLNGITIQNGCFSINGTCIGSGGTLTGTNASAGRVPFWTSANNISGDDSFWWDNTNKRLGVGSSSPWAKFALVGEALTRPLFSVATSTTNGTYSTLFSVEQMPDKFTFLNPRSWANIHLGGATTSERFDMDNIEMFGRVNRDTLLIDCNTLKSSLHTSLTADITAATAGSPCSGGAIFDELTDADLSVVAPGQASSTDGLPGAGGSGANGCNDGGPWYAITASAVTPTQTAGIGGVFRGGTVANHTVATNPAMNVTGGLLVASGTPVMEVTICTPSASASSTMAFGFGFTDVALNTMPFNVGPTTANGAYFMASSTNTWRLVSHNGGTGSANTNIVETTLATSTTKATPQTFRIARTATSTYVYQMNYGASPATWTLVAVSSSQQTSRSFSWFIANVQTVVAKRRTHLYFRDLQVWYSPTYRF